MGELRKDYILDRWVIISAGRKKRPKQFKKSSSAPKDAVDFFAPGNEEMTPAEIGRIPGPDGSWKVRWFENKFPAFTPEGQSFIKSANRFFTFASSYGYHEIIVETPDQDRQLAELTKEELLLVFEVYRDRINALSKLPHIKYVNVFKNSGPLGGTSILHTHSQIMATISVPPCIQDEVDASRKFVECPYCKIVDVERRSIRNCAENDTFVAFAPYASRYNYECWVFPKKHIRTMSELDDKMMKDLIDVMKHLLSKIHDLGCSYNYFIHYAPGDADLHFHITITPRIAVWGGFEITSGIIINSVPPEDAAKYYRGEE